MGFHPTITVAADGVPTLISPNVAEVKTPARFGDLLEEVLVKLPSIDKIRFNSSARSLSDPTTDTPKEIDPAGCIVRRLSSIWILAFVRALKICVASRSPSVSLEYDLIPFGLLSDYQIVVRTNNEE